MCSTRDERNADIFSKNSPRNQKSLFVYVAALLCLVFVGRFPAGATQSVTLAWDPSPDPAIVGYTVYYGSASEAYTEQVPAGNSTSVTLSNLQEAVTYFFVVTASDASGLESPPSNEVSYTVPGVMLNIEEPDLPDFPNCVFITASGTVPQTWTLEESTDLQTWVPFVTGTDIPVQVPVEIDAQQMFFRLKGG